jgi:hypothetical protein
VVVEHLAANPFDRPVQAVDGQELRGLRIVDQLQGRVDLQAGPEEPLDDRGLDAVVKAVS